MPITVPDTHGREARTPSEIPKRGWRDILLRTKDQINEDNLSIVGAGVAFYAFLSIFPGIGAVVSLLGLVIDPSTVTRFIDAAGSVLPPDTLRILDEQVRQVVSSSNGTLSVSLAVGIVLALWSATAAVKALMTALNIVYEEHETRGFFRYYAVAILLTLGVIVFLAAALLLVTILPIALQLLPIPSFVAIALGLLRWAILAGSFMFALAVLYRYAPNRRVPKWRWVSWGAVVATVLWIAGSVIFSYYVKHFGDYNKTYGALGAIVVLMTWFYLTATVVLLGAELNSEMEHQTRVDSTPGKPKPMGRRGARMADTMGESR